MNDKICLALFVFFWVTFCNILFAIYDKLCYLVLDYAIKVPDEDFQKRISQILGA